jgi:hypothetical protein
VADRITLARPVSCVAAAVTSGAAMVASGGLPDAGGAPPAGVRHVAARHRAVHARHPVDAAAHAAAARWLGGNPAAHEDGSMRKQHRFPMGMAYVALLALGVQWTTAATVTRAAGLEEARKTEAAVVAVDQHWMDAELAGDSAWLDAMLLPEYRSVGADGTVHPKAAIIAHAAKNRGNDAERRKVEAWLKANPLGKSVVIRGDTGIITFYDPQLGPQNGVRSSDIFVYQGGRWHALYSQHSAVGSR